ncbi:MAG: hypothetical protein K6U87_12650 [Firmicutes bacterium]|nr:hypothetical protein [Bacillota bacterium]
MGWSPFYIGFGAIGMVAIALGLLELVSGQRLWGLGLMALGALELLWTARRPPKSAAGLLASAATFFRQRGYTVRSLSNPAPDPAFGSELLQVVDAEGNSAYVGFWTSSERLSVVRLLGWRSQLLNRLAAPAENVVVITPQPCEPAVKRHAEQQGLRVLDQRDLWRWGSGY